MKSIQSLLVFIFAGVILISCASGLRYSGEKDVVGIEGVEIQSEGVANASSGEITVTSQVKNNRATGILIVGEVVQLQSPEGVRVSPAGIDAPEFILPGDSAEVSFSFKPINSRKLHHYTGLSGDMERSYEMSLEFIQDNENNPLSTNMLRIEVPVEQYRKYLEKHAIEPKLGLYRPAMSLSNLYSLIEPYIMKNIPAFTRTLHSHGDHNEHTEEKVQHSIIIQGQEYFLDGLLVRVALFRVGKEATLLLKVVNRRHETHQLDLDRITLIEEGRVLHASGIETKVAEKGPKHVLKYNDRKEFYLKYPLKTDAASLELSLEGVMYEDKRSWFPGPITYTNDNLGLTRK